MLYAIAIGRNDVTGGCMFGAIETRNARAESIEQTSDALVPIGRTHDDEEIIAADMADEIQSRGKRAL